VGPTLLQRGEHKIKRFRTRNRHGSLRLSAPDLLSSRAAHLHARSFPDRQNRITGWSGRNAGVCVCVCVTAIDARSIAGRARSSRTRPVTNLIFSSAGRDSRDNAPSHDAETIRPVARGIIRHAAPRLSRRYLTLSLSLSLSLSSPPRHLPRRGRRSRGPDADGRRPIEIRRVLL